MPAADRGGVAATYGHLRLVLFSATGGVQWQAERLGLREEAPLLLPDVVVAPADDGLVAVDRGSGHIRWDSRVGEEAATPVVAGGLVVMCTGDGSLVGLDLATGQVVWRLRLPGRAEGPPATDGVSVAVTWEPDEGPVAGMTVVEAATGRVRWTVRLRAGGVSGPAIATSAPGGDFAVVVDDELQAKAFDLRTGRRRWAVGLGGAGSPEVPPLALAAGRVLVADRLAGLTLVDADGRRTWHARVGGAAVRGGPVAVGRDGPFALPLWSGRWLVSGPGRRPTTFQPPGGIVSGVAVGAGGALVVSSAQGDDNQLVVFQPL
jgi:outer membrane protein assembly factor BamB